MILLTLLACADIKFSLHDGLLFSSETGADSGWESGGWESGGWESGSWDTGGWGGGEGEGEGEGEEIFGEYGAHQILPFSMTFVAFIRAADVTGDGLLDVIVTGSSDGSWSVGQRTVVLGQAIQQADGSFVVTEQTLDVTGGARSFFDAGDVDGDGADDIVLGHVGGFTVWYGGSEGLTEGETYADAWTSALALGDLDEDGDLDLGVMNSDLELAVFSNDAGLFTEQDRFGLDWTYSADFDYSDVAILDLDEDGAMDIITLAPWNADSVATLEVHLGDGAGGVEHSSVLYDEMSTNGPYRFAIGDFNGDETTELVYGHTRASVSTLGWSDGAFGSTERYRTESTGGWQMSGDVDGDGDADLLNASLYDFEILVQDGGELHSQGLEWVTEVGTGFVASRIAEMGDLNGDGCQDVVMTSYPDGVQLIPYLCAEEEEVEEEEEEELPGEELGELDSAMDTGTPVRPKTASGMCSTGRDGAATWALIGLASLALGARRRR